MFPVRGMKDPCRTRYNEVEDPEQDAATLINKVQRHGNCNPQTCLRKKKNSNTYECKAKFPKEMRARSVFLEDEKHIGEYSYLPARNDPRLNQYPKRRWLQIFRANMDIKPVLSKMH